MRSGRKHGASKRTEAELSLEIQRRIRGTVLVILSEAQSVLYSSTNSRVQ